jgi:hypothetical protein
LVAGAALVAFATRAAEASPCDAALGQPFTGPAEIGVREAGLGVPRAPCRRRELLARLDAGATVDTPEFYGTLVATTRLGVRWPLAWLGGLEVSADAAVVDYRFAQNASLKLTEATSGPIAFGLLWEGGLRLGGWPVSLAPALRVVAPGSRLGVDGDRGAFELALHAGARPLGWLSLDAHLGALAILFADVDGQTAHHHEAYAAAGAGFVVEDWLALLVGAEVGFGFYDDGLDHVLARGGVRLGTRRWGRYDLAALVPFAGAERADLVLLLAWSRPL